MRALRGTVLAGLLALLLWPEPARYRAERAIRLAADGLRYVLTHSSEIADPPAALEQIAGIARDAAPALPGDPRPRILEGSARLVRGEAARALEIYRQALALGERGEIDLNAARALERLGQEEDARAGFVRCAWVSPALLAAMLPDVQGPVAEQVARLEAELQRGNLRSPPPLPPPLR